MLQSYLTYSFKRFDQVHDYTVRQAQFNFKPLKLNINHAKKYLSYRGEVVWGNLLNEIKLSMPDGNFKSRMKFNNV